MQQPAAAALVAHLDAGDEGHLSSYHGHKPGCLSLTRIAVAARARSGLRFEEGVLHQFFGQTDVAEPRGERPDPGSFLGVDLFELTGAVQACQSYGRA